MQAYVSIYYIDYILFGQIRAVAKYVLYYNKQTQILVTMNSVINNSDDTCSINFS